MDSNLIETKNDFVESARSLGPRQFFRAVKALKSGSSPPQWEVSDLFPDKSQSEVGDEVTKYFTKITDTFEPLQPGRVQAPTREPVTIEHVRRILKDAKKPDSMVKGDMLQRLMKECHTDVAIPARRIYNAVFDKNEWPSQWKRETTVVIPKTTSPTDLGECRNISCTPFLSKVLESILLEDLKKEIPIDPVQYGGLKGSSVDHLLVDLYEQVLAPLDEGNPALVVSVDYEKAFNRLDHGECLRQLRANGASEASTALVRSFLTQRSMSVRIGESLSTPRALCGGSPQGSILGCFLYCIATQQIGPGLQRPRPNATASRNEQQGQAPGSPPAALHPQQPVQQPSPEAGMQLLEARLPNLDDSTDGSDSFLTAEGPDTSSSGGEHEGEVNRDSITTFKYIDDTTTVEAIDKETTTKHFTVATTEEHAPAPATKDLIDRMVVRTNEIGMRINGKKTQAVCVSSNNGCNTTSELQIAGETIRSGDQMKLLGFIISSRPGMHAQVAHIKQKFRCHFWSLIHLQGAGLSGDNLFRMYTIYVRPALVKHAH